MIVSHSVLSMTSINAKPVASIVKHDAPPRQPLEPVVPGLLPRFDVPQITPTSIPRPTALYKKRSVITKEKIGKQTSENGIPKNTAKKKSISSSATTNKKSKPMIRPSSATKISLVACRPLIARNSKLSTQKHQKIEQQLPVKLCVTTYQPTNSIKDVSVTSNVPMENLLTTSEPQMSVKEFQKYLQDIIDSGSASLPTPTTNQLPFDEVFAARLTEILHHAEKSSSDLGHQNTYTKRVSPPWDADVEVSNSKLITDKRETSQDARQGIVQPVSRFDPACPLSVLQDVLQGSRDCLSRVLEDGQELLQSARDLLTSQPSVQTTQLSEPQTSSTLIPPQQLSVLEKARPATSRQSALGARQKVPLATGSKQAAPITATISRATQTAKIPASHRPMSATVRVPKADTMSLRTTKILMHPESRRTQIQQRKTAPKIPPSVINLPLDTRKLKLNVAATRQLHPQGFNINNVGSHLNHLLVSHTATQTDGPEVVLDTGRNSNKLKSRLQRRDLQPLQVPRALITQPGPSIGISPVPIEPRSNNMKLLSITRVSPPNSCVESTSSKNASTSSLQVTLQTKDLPSSEANSVQNKKDVEIDRVTAAVQTVAIDVPQCHAIATQVSLAEISSSNINQPPQEERLPAKFVERHDEQPLTSVIPSITAHRPSLVSTRVIDLHVGQIRLLETGVQTDTELRGAAVQTQEQLKREWGTQTTLDRPVTVATSRPFEVGPGGDVPTPLRQPQVIPSWNAAHIQQPQIQSAKSPRTSSDVSIQNHVTLTSSTTGPGGDSAPINQINQTVDQGVSSLQPLSEITSAMENIAKQSEGNIKIVTPVFTPPEITHQEDVASKITDTVNTTRAKLIPSPRADTLNHPYGKLTVNVIPDKNNENDGTPHPTPESAISKHVSPTVTEPLTIDTSNTLPLLRLSSRRVLPWSLPRPVQRDLYCLTAQTNSTAVTSSSATTSTTSSVVDSTGSETCSDDITDTASEATTLCADLVGGGSVESKGSQKSEGEVTVRSIGEIIPCNKPLYLHSIGEVNRGTIPFAQKRRVLQLASRVAPNLLISSHSISEGEVSEGQVIQA